VYLFKKLKSGEYKIREIILMKIQSSCFVNLSTEKTCCKKTVIFVIGLWIMLVLLSCSSKVASDLPSELISNKKTPSIEAFDFQTTYSDSGVVRYFLKTPKLLIFSQEKSPYKEFPEGFHLQQFNESKKIISELSANYGKNLEHEQKWIATGNVVMVNDKGDTLRTEELIYLIKEDRIFSEKFVSIKKGDQDITGTGGFESDSQMRKWAFKKTKGHIYVDEQ